MYKKIYKKLISGFLAVTILISNSSVVFGKGTKSYKPASSFQYDYFTLGDTDEVSFSMDYLIEDLRNNREDPTYTPQTHKSNFLKNNHTSTGVTTYAFTAGKAYNDYLYYNYYPEKSPYWKWTAFEPNEEEGVTEDDVLRILVEQKKITGIISQWLKTSKKYKEARAQQQAINWTIGAVLAVVSFFIWEVIPLIGGGGATAGAAATAGATAATGATGTAAAAGAAAGKITASKVLTFIGLLLTDILVGDDLAYYFRNLESVENELDDVDIYTAVAISNQNETQMLSEHLQSRDTATCQDTIAAYNQIKAEYENQEMPYEVERQFGFLESKKNFCEICDDADRAWSGFQEAYKYQANKRDGAKWNPELMKNWRKWEQIKNFCHTRKLVATDTESRVALGEYLLSQYRKQKNSKEYIKYARRTMLRFYYSARFIEAELMDGSDRLRFDRAFIDIITTYKLGMFVIEDGRLRKMFSKSRIESHDIMDAFRSKGTSDEDLSQVVMEDSYGNKETVGANLMNAYSAYEAYPTLLPRAQVNYIVQRWDIESQKKNTKKGEEKVREDFRKDATRGRGFMGSAGMRR